jgi:hypothetical protein
MKKVAKYTIIQTNIANEVYKVAINVDIHYSIEICEALSKLHPQFNYSYYKQ